MAQLAGILTASETYHHLCGGVSEGFPPVSLSPEKEGLLEGSWNGDLVANRGQRKTAQEETLGNRHNVRKPENGSPSAGSKTSIIKVNTSGESRCPCLIPEVLAPFQ
ncbi:hypothetical protein CapIbe_003869 [Capra ibex]